MSRDDTLLDYMQNRLPAEDRAAFEADMARDPRLQAEVTALRAAANDLGNRDVPVGARDEGWARLSQAIEAERAPEPANSNRRFTMLKVAGIVVATVLVWQFAVVPQLPGRQPGFVTVTETAEGPALRVAFAASTPMQDVTTLLQQIGARIVDGPGALGLYSLSFDSDLARDDAERVLSDDQRVISLSRP